MSFSNFKDYIEEGDTVILYLGVNQIKAIKVERFILNKHGVPGPNTAQTVYGALNVIDLVGKKFGSKIQLTKGYGYALYPTSELWTQTLPHRTQILYTPDISMVIMELNICAGSIVCEAGTGSGSLSHSFLRSIGQEGHLYTCDFHQDRVEKAKKEFESHGFGSRVTITRRDVCEEGWDVKALADAVFLDLPKPWEAIPHAISATKSTGGRICSFSPCVEQVCRTSECMRELGLTNINTVENLQREFQFRLLSLPPVPFQQCPVDELPIFQNIPNKKRRYSGSNETTDSVQANGVIEIDQNCVSHSNDESKMDTLSVPNLIPATSELSEDSPMSEIVPTEDAAKKEDISTQDSTNNEKNVSTADNSPVNNEITKKDKPIESKFRSGIPLLKMPGHTGFLTFATVPPFLRRESK